jgi:hypothetical protein
VNFISNQPPPNWSNTLIGQNYPTSKPTAPSSQPQNSISNNSNLNELSRGQLTQISKELSLQVEDPPITKGQLRKGASQKIEAIISEQTEPISFEISKASKSSKDPRMKLKDKDSERIQDFEELELTKQKALAKVEEIQEE